MGVSEHNKKRNTPPVQKTKQMIAAVKKTPVIKTLEIVTWTKIALETLF